MRQRRIRMKSNAAAKDDKNEKVFVGSTTTTAATTITTTTLPPAATTVAVAAAAAVPFPYQSFHFSRRRKKACLIVILLHIVAITWTVVGTILAFEKLHTHQEECDMTWSQRVFYEVPLLLLLDSVSSSSNADADATTTTTKLPDGMPYKLYKFMDARDPRHAIVKKAAAAAAAQAAAITKNNNMTKNWWWCPTFPDSKVVSSNYSSSTSSTMSTTTTNITPVLYIPGHGGNYQQARSLGAHLVLGLTRRRRQSISSRLEQQQQQWHNNNNNNHNNPMDVYTVDFQEEGTALHPAYLQRQTEFVQHVIQFLDATCGGSSISSSRQTTTTNHNNHKKNNNNINNKTRTMSDNDDDDVDSSSSANLLFWKPWVLVGHSMGGWVARAAASAALAAATTTPNNNNNNNNNNVQAIVTLATPHRRPVLSWSVWQWHRQHILLSTTTEGGGDDDDEDKEAAESLLLKTTTITTKNDIPILSISGGLRDEMVPPEVMELLPQQQQRPVSNTLMKTILATDMMYLPTDNDDYDDDDDNNKKHQIQPTLGMDHPAIVWCHNLLAPLKERLVQFIKANGDAKALLHNSNNKNRNNNNNTTYVESVQRQREALRSIFGTWQAMAMETGVVYNVEWLVWFYAFIGASYFAFDIDSSSNNNNNNNNLLVATIMIPITTTVLTLLAGPQHVLCPPPLHAISVVALAFTANTVFWVLQTGLRILLPCPHLFLAYEGFTFFSMLLLLGRTWNNPQIFYASVLGSALALTLWVGMAGRGTRSTKTTVYKPQNCSRILSGMAWIIPLQFLLVAGDFMVLSWSSDFGIWLTAAFKLSFPPFWIMKFVRETSEKDYVKNSIVHWCQQLVAAGVLAVFGLGQFPFLGELHPVGGLVLGILCVASPHAFMSLLNIVAVTFSK